MRIARLFVPPLCLAIAMAISVVAQTERKAGLWKMNLTRRQQRIGESQAMSVPLPANIPTETKEYLEVCVSQEMLEKFGAPLPRLEGDCTVSHVTMKATAMTAKFSCRGEMAVMGSIKSNWANPSRITSTIHYSGTVQSTASRMGPGPLNESAVQIPVEWNVESNSTYVGPDCGSVPPLPMPAVQ